MSKNCKFIETIINLLYPYNKECDNMIYPSIDKLLNEVGSKYLLVNLISKRVKELDNEKNYQMKESSYTSKKNIGKALEEVYSQLIHIQKKPN